MRLLLSSNMTAGIKVDVAPEVEALDEISPEDLLIVMVDGQPRQSDGDKEMAEEEGEGEEEEGEEEEAGGRRGAGARKRRAP